ncbi:predicted protein [Histoplasma capsulatum G186AR]|uniref:Uncharacterized protein n=1 Tax=Ajellomyces capsulatus (strain G186AR / H82 / ATCC MYA-2454 / RMSCC 2432) TaxID=447093 RepID=C0NVW4_AJECG|nr:uncharacterized protein HCBG_07294 [Histoplasma capsulatum G186AR]EEH04653.1 predicted protein [Histoplasma capsulatum G186AR]
MAHKVVSSYSPSAMSSQDGKGVKIHNASRDAQAKGFRLEEANGSSRTQPRKPHLRRDETFRLRRQPMEVEGSNYASRRLRQSRSSLFSGYERESGRIQDRTNRLKS